MEDRERRIGRLEGRQEMILEWLDRLEKDLHGLKDRLADEGVLDYTEEIDEMQDSIDRLRERISYDPKVPDSEDEGGADPSTTSSWNYTISNPQQVLAAIALFIVFVLGAIALARNQIAIGEIIPW